MKKQIWFKTFLLLMSALAVGLATTTDSVTVFDKAAGTAEFYSYFDLMPIGNLQMVTPLAGLLCLIAGVLTVIHMFSDRQWLVKAITLLSFAGATFAVIPVLNQGDVLVLPNVGVPIFLLCQAAMGVWMGRHSQEEKDLFQKKLKRR